MNSSTLSFVMVGCYNVDLSKGVHRAHEMSYYLSTDPKWNSMTSFRKNHLCTPCSLLCITLLRNMGSNTELADKSMPKAFKPHLISSLVLNFLLGWMKIAILPISKVCCDDVMNNAQVMLSTMPGILEVFNGLWFSWKFFYHHKLRLWFQLVGSYKIL